MKKQERYQNFIIYLFLVVLMITGAGYGLGEECQVFSSFYEKQGSSISTPRISANNNIHTFQVRERNSVSLRYNRSRDNRSEASLRGSFVFLCVLAILSVFFRLIQGVFIHFRRLYVHERYIVINFMQDMDGRKRIS